MCMVLSWSIFRAGFEPFWAMQPNVVAIIGAPAEVLRGAAGVYNELLRPNRTLRYEFLRRLLNPVELAATLSELTENPPDLR